VHMKGNHIYIDKMFYKDNVSKFELYTLRDSITEQRLLAITISFIHLAKHLIQVSLYNITS